MEDDAALSEIDSDMYRDTSDFIGNLGRQEYERAEERQVKETAMETATSLISLMLETRLEKAARLTATQDGAAASLVMQRLLDEEKFILDSDEERDERQNAIVSATREGRSKLLETIAESYKTGRTVVRFLHDVDQMMGADMEKYGPYKAEDIATIPHENAQGLVLQNVAVRVRWQDYG